LKPSAQGASDFESEEAASPSVLTAMLETPSVQLPTIDSDLQADLPAPMKYQLLNSKEKRQLFSQILGGARGKRQLFSQILGGGKGKRQLFSQILGRGSRGKRQLFSQILGKKRVGQGKRQLFSPVMDGVLRGKRQLFSQILSRRQERRNVEKSRGFSSDRYKRSLADVQPKASRLFSQILRKKLVADGTINKRTLMETVQNE